MILDFLRRYLPVVLLIMWVVVVGVFGLQKKVSFSEEAPSMHAVLLISEPSEKPRSMAYEAVVLDCDQSSLEGNFINGDKPYFSQDALLYFTKDTAKQYSAGDVVVCRTQIEQGRGFVRYGESTRIESRSAAEIGWTEGKLRFLALRARDALEKRLEKYITDEEELALTESLLLGDRRKLKENQRYAFQDAGAMHVLAVSGLHVGIILGIVMWMLTLGGRVVIRWENYRLRRLQKWLALGLIWGYAFLTGMSVSVMRSALMFSFLPLGELHKESPLKYNRLAVAALIILLINPSALVSPSFLLSFSAVLAIMYYCPRWKKRLPHLRAHSAVGKRVIKMGEYVENLLLMSLAAQIGTLPFTLLFFGQSANWFFLTNLLVLPLAEYGLMPFGIAALAASYLPFGWLTSVLMWITDRAAWLMNMSVRWVQELPGATSFFTFNPVMCALLVCIIISLSAALRLRGWKKWTAMIVAALSACGFLIIYSQSL